jgi:uncharacterized membrane protein YqhA
LESSAQNQIDRQVPKLRYIFILPIIGSYIASAVLMVLGFLALFRSIFEAFTHAEGEALHTLRLEFIETLDVFLLATILYVIGNGFYQLFVGGNVKVAPWMKVNSVHDLEVMLLGVTVTLLGVTGLAGVMSWDGQSNLLQLGVTVALLIGAIAYFLGRTKH